MLFDYGDKNFERKKNASSGNRTRAARVAGEHSTTEPTMQAYFSGENFKDGSYCVLNAKDFVVCSCGRVVKATDSKSVSLWERRFES